MADSPSSGNDECAARPLARSLTRRMPRVATTQPIVGRLSVDEKPAPSRGLVRASRAVAAPLFADDEQEPDARLAFQPQPIGGGDLRGQNPFRIARAAAVQTVALDPAGEKRRHAIDVRGKGDRHTRMLARLTR